MMKSMTAFGRTSTDTEIGKFTIHLQSVNRKFFEINFSLPNELSFLEPCLRKLIQAHVHRGYLNFTLYANYKDSTPQEVFMNIPLARKIYKTLNQLAETLHIQDAPTLSELLKFQEIYKVVPGITDEDKLKQILEEMTLEVLEDFNHMREKEGDVILIDLKQRISHCKKNINQIKQLANKAPELYREKLHEKLKNLDIDQERLFKEVALLSEKVDISEEVTRTQSHLDQFSQIVELKEPLGKKLDFLTQELIREVNTILAKTTQLEVKQTAIEMKVEFERIREQLQNIE